MDILELKFFEMKALRGALFAKSCRPPFPSCLMEISSVHALGDYLSHCFTHCPIPTDMIKESLYDDEDISTESLYGVDDEKMIKV